jgi:hypothetical protein
MHLVAVVLDEHLENTEVPVELEAVVNHIRDTAGIVLAANPLASLRVLLDVVVMHKIVDGIQVVSGECLEEMIQGVAVLLLGHVIPPASSQAH